MATPGPPPPPPPPGQVGGQRGNPAPMGRPPQPPPGAQIPRPGPPQGMPMQMPIRQQSTRIQDITPAKLMDESACLKKLTTYSAFTIRKCPPRDPKKEGRGTWARSEITEERWSQEDMIKQIKKLGERSGRGVADKKKALMPNQQGQITTLLDNLASSEQDRAFEWSLVQLDSVTKPVSLKGSKKREMYETVTMLAFMKRAPRRDLNPVILFQNIEKMKAESMRPPQPQPQPQGPHPGAEPIQIFPVKDGKGKDKGRSKSREKKYHDRDDSSTGDSFDSDTDSHSSYTGSDSLGTSISSQSRGHRRHSHSKGASRKHSKHRDHRRTYYQERPRSPELQYEAYGGSPRPYVVPDVPRAIPAALPAFDPVAAAYHAGKVDAEAERFGTADRLMPRPVERAVIERVRPVISYGHVEPRYAEARYHDDRYIDDLRQDNLLRRREREAEEYIIEGRLDGRDDGRRLPEFDRRGSLYDRRPEPVIWNNRHPFAPAQLPRRYPPSSSLDSGW